MSLHLPAELHWLSWVVGSDWPEGDEDSLARCADAWAAAAHEIRQLLPDAEVAGMTAVSAVDGDVAVALRTSWSRFIVGDDGYLEQLAHACDELARLCEGTAVQIEYAKYQLIIALIALATTITTLQAAAVGTFGMSTAGIPVAEGATQNVVSVIAWRLLKAVAMGAAENVAMDVAAQLVQLHNGHRKHWDWQLTTAAAEDGAIFDLDQVSGPKVLPELDPTDGGHPLADHIEARLRDEPRPDISSARESAVDGRDAGGEQDGPSPIQLAGSAPVHDAVPRGEGLETSRVGPARPSDGTQPIPSRTDPAPPPVTGVPGTPTHLVDTTSPPAPGSTGGPPPGGAGPRVPPDAAAPDPGRAISDRTPATGIADRAPATGIGDRAPAVGPGRLDPPGSVGAGVSAPAPTAPVDHRTPGLAALVVGPLARGAAAPPGTPGAPGRAGAPSQGWRTRSSAGPDVAWSDSAGRTLTTAQSSAADAFLDSARQAEPRITTAVRDLAERVGGELYGLDDRLKGPDSVKRKLADELSRRPAQTVAAALAMMRDAVRYTVGIPDSRYASGAQAAVDALSEGGYDPVKLTNSWGEPGGYRGINSFWRDPETGQVFELQLHTPASFEAKSAMHDALDQPIRTPTDPTDPAELVRLRARLDEVFALVPVPDGAASVRLPNGVDRQAQAASVDQPRPAGALTRS